jgi:sodium pump decarboxylase gamma subunit
MYDNFIESLLLLVVGMAGVFSALLLLAAMIWTFRMIDERLNKRRIQKYAAKVESKLVDDVINDELVAVLTAAAASVLKKPIRMKRIQFLAGAGTDSAAWAATGRLNVMASHSIPKRK